MQILQEQKSALCRSVNPVHHAGRTIFWMKAGADWAGFFMSATFPG